MTIQEILRDKVAGKWKGVYTVLHPSGEVIDSFDSLQEGRMEGEAWIEEVTYLRPGQEPEARSYRATVRGDHVEFEDDEMWGETHRIGDEAIVFIFGWVNRPEERIVEFTRPMGSQRSRVWQHFSQDKLTKLTVVAEHRIEEAASRDSLGDL